MNPTDKPFVVRFVTLVDCPERRGDTYSPVPQNHRFMLAWAYATQADAVRVAEAIMHRGECDFGSEFVISVQVLRMRANASPRVVRKLRRRDARGGDWRVDRS